ncbi:MAG: AarF/ABC1/UbiB kinase family protein [Deltaproteobacteria bacterium]|nr:AarF/ABC1/UbiB kinase family protein [Deltaproteobacteria bacterium]
MQPAGRVSDLRVVHGDRGEGDRSRGKPTSSSTPPLLDIRPSRAPGRALRIFKAYWVTLLVIASYVSVKMQAKFRSPAFVERLLLSKHKKNARRIERAIVSLQGLFIKVGQLISIMTNFLPPEFRQELEGLQDQVPPRPYKDIEARIREEFGGKSPRDLYAEFSERPIAAASIGQVHVARLHSGTKVAVKVQYPDIEEVVQLDLRTLRRIFTIIGHFLPYQGLDQVYREIRDMLLQELDFRVEAENSRRIAENFAGRTDVGFPVVIDELTTSRVLTTRWEAGTKIGDIDGLDAEKVDRKALARQVVEAYCQQIFVDGLYHADPHPGNLLVRPLAEPAGETCLIFLDFGAVAEVSPKMRQGIVDFLQGAIRRDTQQIVRAMKDMGFIARGADDRVFDRVVEYFHQRFQEEIEIDSLSLKDVRFDPKKGLEKLADLRRMNISIRDLSDNFLVPKEWILLERTILLLMGLCTALDPEMNPMSVIRPYLERFVLGPDQDWSKFVMNTTKDLALAAVALPGELRRFVSRAQRGELEVGFRNVQEAAELLYTLGHQAIYAAVGIAGSAIALVLEGRGRAGDARTAWWVALGSGVLLLGSMWMTRVRRKRRNR